MLREWWIASWMKSKPIVSFVQGIRSLLNLQWFVCLCGRGGGVPSKLIQCWVAIMCYVNANMPVFPDMLFHSAVCLIGQNPSFVLLLCNPYSSLLGLQENLYWPEHTNFAALHFQRQLNAYVVWAGNRKVTLNAFKRMDLSEVWVHLVCSCPNILKTYQNLPM